MEKAILPLRVFSNGFETPPLPRTSGELAFSTGFEPGSINVGGDLSTDIVGVDVTVPAPNDWEGAFDAYPDFGDFKTGGFCAQASISPGDHIVRLTDDPTGQVNLDTGEINQVLHMVNRNPDASSCGWTTRPGSQISDVSGDLEALYFRTRLFLPSDVSLWEGCPGWLQLWETKRELNLREGFFGISFHLEQDNQTDGLFWRANSRVCCGDQQPDWTWTHYNKAIPVPLDEWVTIEIYWQKGVEQAGRFLVTMQRDGEDRQVLFDVADSTVPPDEPDTLMYQWKMGTVYTSKQGAQCVVDKGGELNVYWDDWVLRDGLLQDE